MKLILLIFLISSNFFLSQKVESIYVLTKERRFNNYYKNYTERDSIVLYKDSTFRRENNYWGFDEIHNKIFLGKWKFSKEYLLLKAEKRDDSSKVTSLEPFETIIKLNHLKKNTKKSNKKFRQNLNFFVFIS